MLRAVYSRQCGNNKYKIYTVKPLLSGHPRGSVRSIRGVRLIEVLVRRPPVNLVPRPMPPWMLDTVFPIIKLCSNNIESNKLYS